MVRVWVCPSQCRPSLFINSNASIQDIAKRAEAQVPDDIVRYARDHNVLIVRPIDLLLLMLQLENDPHKKSTLMHLLLSSTGWLKADQESQTYFHTAS